MRNAITILILHFILASSDAQEFTVSNLIPIQKDYYQNDVLHRNFLFKFYLLRNEKDTLAHFTINNEDCDFNYELTIKKLTDLDEFTSAIKLDLYYTCCATSLDSYYFLVKKDNDIIRLNPIHNVSNDGPIVGYDLIFPHDLRGIENTIAIGKKYIDSCGDLSFVERIQTIYPSELNNY